MITMTTDDKIIVIQCPIFDRVHYILTKSITRALIRDLESSLTIIPEILQC